MPEENQFEITKSLTCLIVGTILASIGGEIGSHYNNTALPGSIIGLLTGALIVALVMKNPGNILE